MGGGVMVVVLGKISSHRHGGHKAGYNIVLTYIL